MENSVECAWLRRRTPPARGALNTVVLPHAGGSTAYYRGLEASLRRHCNVYVAQYPARQDRLRERGITSILGLVDGLLPETASLAPEPLVLFGHSMGSLVAYELCRELEHLGYFKDILLIVSGRASPTVDLPQRVDPEDTGSIVAEVQWLGTDLSDFTPEDLRELFLPSLQADYRAVAGYKHVDGRLLNSSVRVFYGADDPRVAPEHALAWQRCAAEPIATRTFAGGHFYFSEAPEVLADAIIAEATAWAGDRKR